MRKFNHQPALFCNAKRSSCSRHTKVIQDSNYLQMISEDIYEAMAEVVNTKRGTDYIGSYWFELLHTALQTNHPELEEKALEHASDITKIGIRGLFRIPSVDITPRSLLDQREGNGSRGGTRTRTSYRTQDFKS